MASPPTASVADIDLAAGDVVLAAVEGGGLGESSHGVLGCGVRCGVRPRPVRRNRAVVDNPAEGRGHQRERC
jgi:hypothetical protein